MEPLSGSILPLSVSKATRVFCSLSLVCSLRTTSSASGGPPTSAVTALPASQLPSATTTVSSSSAPNVSVVPVDTVAARVLQSLLTSAQHLGVSGVAAAPATAVSSSLPQPAAGAGTNESCVFLWWLAVEYICVLSVCSLGFLALRGSPNCVAAQCALLGLSPSGRWGSAAHAWLAVALGRRWWGGQLGALLVFLPGREIWCQLAA